MVLLVLFQLDGQHFEERSPIVLKKPECAVPARSPTTHDTNANVEDFNTPSIKISASSFRLSDHSDQTASSNEETRSHVKQHKEMPHDTEVGLLTLATCFAVRSTKESESFRTTGCTHHHHQLQTTDTGLLANRLKYLSASN